MAFLNICILNRRSDPYKQFFVDSKYVNNEKEIMLREATSFSMGHKVTKGAVTNTK